MTSPLLPQYVPVRLAAVLAGRSLASFKRHCLRAVAVPGEGRRVEVSLSALEWLLGAPITPEVYLHAERRLDHQRDRERAKKQNHHAARRSDADR